MKLVGEEMPPVFYYAMYAGILLAVTGYASLMLDGYSPIPTEVAGQITLGGIALAIGAPVSGLVTWLFWGARYP